MEALTLDSCPLQGHPMPTGLSSRWDHLEPCPMQHKLSGPTLKDSGVPSWRKILTSEAASWYSSYDTGIKYIYMASICSPPTWEEPNYDRHSLAYPSSYSIAISSSSSHSVVVQRSATIPVARVIASLLSMNSFLKARD